LSESYKISEDGLYYVTFAVVGWMFLQDGSSRIFSWIV